MMRTRLYGLNIDSELTFHEDRPATGPADVTIRIGPPATASDDPPPGRRLLHLAVDRQYFTGTETDDGYILRFHGTCDFEIDSELRSVTARVVPGTDGDKVSVLAAGTMLSFLLTMRGATVLHASAVQMGESALAFVGRAGMGKSTMATIMCAGGAAIITDDVLNLDLSTSPPACHLGATETRLRKAADELADRFDDRPTSRVTGDQRDALRLRAATDDQLPLRAIVIPVPDHEAPNDQPEVTRLNRKAALLSLLQFPRIVGWEDPGVLDRQLEEVARVVEAVPVFVARMPWGPPFPARLADRISDHVGLSQVRAADSTASR